MREVGKYLNYLLIGVLCIDLFYIASYFLQSSAPHLIGLYL